MKSYWLLSWLLLPSCVTSGNAWVREPLVQTDNSEWDGVPPLRQPQTSTKPPGLPVSSRTLGEKPEESYRAGRVASQIERNPHIVDSVKPRTQRRKTPNVARTGTVLGIFRNTYYDFPAETDFGGELVTLHNAQCKPLTQVPFDFFDALCVQGSGLLRNGNTVSFNRRDCQCAAVCPKTQQRICFDALELEKFPWGRGATGQAITPFLTVAVDSDVIPLGTPVYIPDFEGLPRDASRNSLHDGCFIAQDRGLKVKGQHVDVFTGQRAMTQLWNGLVPSNTGVTVIVDNPKCARAD